MLPTVGAIVSVIAEQSDRLRVALPGEEERSGAGVREYSDGSRYEGEFANGLKHGRGRYTWKNGESYEGSFYKDFRHGNGVYCWPSGHKFIGKFYLNRKEGYGQHVYPNGSHFQGLYHVGQRLGPGVLSYPDGRQDVGLWHNERLLQLCTTVGEGFTLKDLPEYAAYMDSSTTAEESVMWSHTSSKHPKSLQFLDDSYILPTGIEVFSTNGDDLPLPPKRREELDQCFYGDEWEPDPNPYQGYERDPLFTLPLETRMHAHILKHRRQGKNQSWDVEAVLSLTRRGFGPKGHLEVSSEQLILQASRGERRAVAQILRTGLVHPDVADTRRYTALIAATVNCCDDVIEVLLDMGADIDKLNGENMSALAVCHVLYYPFHSLYTAELQDHFTDKETQVELVKSEEETNKDRPDTMETAQTHSLVFSERAVEEETEEVLQHREVSNEKELVVEESSKPTDPQTSADSDLDPEDKTDKQQEQEQNQEQETEIKETEDTSIEEDESGVETEDHIEDVECGLNENEKKESQKVAGVERSVAVKDGKIVVGSVQWTEYPAKGKIHGPIETTFDSASSVNSFQIHVTEKALQRSAEALSRTGFTHSLDTAETVRKMAAMKIEHRERLNTLKLLLERGADPNACRVPMPVLFMAVMASDVEAVRRLLLRGARTDVPLPPQRKGLYPLHVAAALPGSAGPKITELLLHAITDPDARACDWDSDQEFSDAIRSTVETRHREGGSTALHVACRRNTDFQNASKIVALLLARGAQTDLLWSGHSPLSLAITSGNEMAVKELLKSGADPNIPLGNGVGSVLCALANNNYNSCGNRQKLLDLLVKAGADILMPVLVDGVVGTAVDYAYYSFKQDTRIATTPYHALNIQEREIYKERQQLLQTMGNVLRQTALQRERERLQRASMGGYDTNGSSASLLKFCLYCSRSASVKLTSCSRCDMVFYCSKACKVKSWNEGHKDECTLVNQRRAKGVADQRKELKSQRGAKGKSVQRALDVTYKAKMTKFMKSDLKPRALNKTEATVEEQPKENYSFI